MEKVRGWIQTKLNVSAWTNETQMNNSSIESDVYLTQPLEIGTIDIEPLVPEGNAVTFYYDDLAVCGLNAPLIPKTKPTPEG